MVEAGGGILEAGSTLLSTFACKPPVPNLKLTQESFRVVWGGIVGSCSVNPVVPMSLSLSPVGVREETSLSGTEQPSSSKDISWESGEEGGEAWLDSTS